jgi:hypothetical protein
VTVVERVNTELYQKLLLEAFAPDMIRSWVSHIQLLIQTVTRASQSSRQWQQPTNITQSTDHFYFPPQII